MAAEALTFDTELLDGPITCQSLSGLRDYAWRGENRILPKAPGRRRTTLILDQLDISLTWFVVGMTDYTGAPHTDPIEGVELNLEHYRALFYGGGAHDISLAWAGDTFTSDDVQVPNYAGVRTGPLTATIITRIVVCGGELEETP